MSEWRRRCGLLFTQVTLIEVGLVGKKTLHLTRGDRFGIGSRPSSAELIKLIIAVSELAEAVVRGLGATLSWRKGSWAASVAN
jgi:hypothetical protein